MQVVATTRITGRFGGSGGGSCSCVSCASAAPPCVWAHHVTSTWASVSFNSVAQWLPVQLAGPEHTPCRILELHTVKARVSSSAGHSQLSLAVHVILYIIQSLDKV